jgi:hypothetical protein
MRKSSPQLPISISPLRQQEAPGSWLLCNGETQSSASCFRIFTCASPWVAPGSWLLAPGSWLLLVRTVAPQRQTFLSDLITPAPYRYSAAPPASKKVW